RLSTRRGSGRAGLDSRAHGAWKQRENHDILSGRRSGLVGSWAGQTLRPANQGRGEDGVSMNATRLKCGLAIWVVIAGAGRPPARAGPEPAAVDFNRDIRPILSESCYQCHGPDRNKRKADLRLDLRSGLFRSVEGTTIVVPGKPDESELLLRVSAEDEDLRMPPPNAGKRLTPDQIERIKRWIEQGAGWKGHWAYLAPSRPPVPRCAKSPHPDNPIDRFIRARLASEGLEPSPEADRKTLIRRLSFDLVGLPPAPEEVEAFVQDTHPDTYEHLVDRLLA